MLPNTNEEKSYENGTSRGASAHTPIVAQVPNINIYCCQ